MDVEYAFLADAALADPFGKLHAIGAGFSVLGAAEFPLVYPYMSFVLKLRLHATECVRPHNLELELWDPDGVVLARLAQRIQTGRPRDPHLPTFTQLVFNLMGQQFPRPGEYAFQVTVDGTRLKEVPLLIERVEKPQRAPEAEG